jgi:hypothetical protein
VSYFSIETKYKALANTTAELIWVEPIPRELRVSLQQKSAFDVIILVPRTFLQIQFFMPTQNILRLTFIL